MLETLRELWRFIRTSRKFWILPILFILLLLSSIIILAEGATVAPFIYALF